MQHNVADLIRELMDVQHLSVRKVSARIAEKHGGSLYGYTQQISRILNDPTYDPSLSTVQKILSALNASLWQNHHGANPVNNLLEVELLTTRLEQLSSDMAELKSGMAELTQAVRMLVEQDSRRSP